MSQRSTYSIKAQEVPASWKAVVFYGLVSIGMGLRDGLADVAAAIDRAAPSAPTRPSDPAGGETARFTTEEP